MDHWIAVDLFDELANLLRHMPRARSGKFVAPGEADLQAFRAWLTALAGGNVASPEHPAAGPGYELLHITDRGDHSQPSLLLREPAPAQRTPYALGWGMYLLRLENEKNMIIEVPHPLHDEGTGQLGLVLYRRLSARALLLAGAHRHANPHGLADPAHNPKTIFHTVHQALVEVRYPPDGMQGPNQPQNESSTGPANAAWQSSEPVVLQLHGFSAQKHPDFPQVIVGGTYGKSQLLLERLAASFSAAGISTGLGKDQRWRNLCGRTNVQAAATPQGVFIHLELSEDLRQPNSPLPDILQSVLG